MKKLYTYDNKQITVCSEFEIKFKDFLEYLKEKDNDFYVSLSTNLDFNIKIKKLVKNFSSFFQKWLKNNFNQTLSIDNLENIFNEIKMTELKYDEFFSYYNFYKKIINTEEKLLHFYDSESESPHQYFNKYF